MESGETSEVFIRRKMVHVNRHTRVSPERELHPYRSVNHSYGAFLPGFLWPVILLCLARWIWINPYLVYRKVLPCMGTYLGQDGFQQRGLQVGGHQLLQSSAPSRFDLQGAILRLCSQQGLLDFEEEKHEVSLSLIWAGLSFSSSWSICPHGKNSSCSAWGPSISCLGSSTDRNT